MKKLFAALILMILLLSLTGCRKSNLAVSADETSVQIVAENASKGMFGATSGFELNEGQKLYIEPSLTKGEINVKIKAFDLGEDASIEELKDAVSGSNADLEINISGSEPLEYELEPGSYSVSASVLSKADGTVQFNVR